MDVIQVSRLHLCPEIQGIEIQCSIRISITKYYFHIILRPLDRTMCVLVTF